VLSTQRQQPDPAAALRKLREAALADETGEQLAAALKGLSAPTQTAV